MFNWSEVHFYRYTSYKIHTLVDSGFVKKHVMNSLTDIIEDVVDGHLDQNTNEDSLHSNDSVNSRESAGGNSTPKLNGNVIKTTVTSVSSHLAVIAKTYTKRHSSSNLQSQQLNPTSTQSSDSTASR